MLNIVLVLCGAFLLVYSAILCHKLSKKLEQNPSVRPSSWILFLIYLFVGGYTAFIGRVAGNVGSHGFDEFLVSVVFFFGAIFVLVTLRAYHKLILKLSNESLGLEKLNSELENKNLSHQKEEIKESEEKYKKRFQELLETLDDFYTLRLSVQEKMNKEEVNEENKIIKERLDKIKNE